MAYRELLACDESTCADTVDLGPASDGTEPPPAWVQVMLPLEASQHFNPQTRQIEWHRPMQVRHFSKASCLALWACGLADKLAAEERAAEQERRAAVGTSEWISPIEQWQSLRKRRQEARRTELQRSQFERLAQWTEGGEQAA